MATQEAPEHQPKRYEMHIDDVLDAAWMYVRYGEDMSVEARRQLAELFVQIADTLAARIRHYEERNQQNPTLWQRLEALCETYAGQRGLL